MLVDNLTRSVINSGFLFALTWKLFKILFLFISLGAPIHGV